MSGSSSSIGRIDQYELLRELGSGGFGCVYLAHDTVSQIDVAVKGLPPLVRNNQNELENIRKNFALVSRLHHPNIAAALTLHPVDEVLYLNETDADKLRVFKGDTLVVMQYACGVTLTRWAKQFPGSIVPLDKAIEITSEIGKALDYAHTENVLHRDIKPENVMIDIDKRSRMVVRVLDFGLAAEIHSSMSRVSNDISDTSGTRPYMAPEQWLGSRQGCRTDQYSLAVLFYELATGKVPFASAFETGDPLVMFGAVSRKEVEVPSWLPQSVRQALSKALSKKQEDRFASCADFTNALRYGVKSRFASFAVGTGALACVLAVAGAVAYRFNNAAVSIEGVAPGKIAEPAAKADVNPVAESVAGPEEVAAPVSDGRAESDVPSSVPSSDGGKKEVESAKGPIADPVSIPDEKPAVSVSERVLTSVVEHPKLPPELRIVAMFEGKEVKGAKIKTMNGTYELPYKWDGNLSNRRQLGPYEVVYERGEVYLTGEFKVGLIDWSGLKTITVELKRSDKKAISGIGVWAF